MRTVKVSSTPLVLSFLLFLWVGTLGHGAELTIADHGYMERYFDNQHCWCAVSVKDGSGEFITGLSLADFELTESIVSPTTGTISGPETIDIAAQIDPEHSEAGFWETSVGGMPLDVVFLVDVTASMEDDMQGIKAQANAFIDRLIANHIDFRMAALAFQTVPNQMDIVPFYGPMEVERLREGIEHEFYAAGENWRPSVAYDALLLTPWLGFREEAQKLVVAITDVVPQTVYGTFWHPVDCTAATLSAAKLFLEAYPDLTLYYSQSPFEHVDYEYYMDPSMNPRAGDGGSGFYALESRGLAQQLAWPFAQSEIPLATQSVDDSRHLLVWESSLPRPDEIGDATLQVTVRFTNPNSPDETVETSYTEPLERERHDLVLNMIGELGQPVDETYPEFWYMTSDRPIWMWVSRDAGPGQYTIGDVPAGKYFVEVRDGGNHPYEYESLRYIADLDLSVPPEGQTLDVSVAIADRQAALMKARGLVADLAAWEVADRPFEEFAAEANAWLDTLDEQGMAWEDMVALKRFYIALSGYANMSYYAERQTQGAVDNFDEIVTDLSNIIAKVEEIQDTVEQDWEEALAEGLLDTLYRLLGAGEVVALKEAVEAGVQELLEYAENRLIPEVKKEIINQIPPVSNHELIKNFLLLLVCGDWDDWESVMATTGELCVNEVIDNVLAEMGQALFDDAFDAIEPDTPLEQVIADQVEAIISALFDGGGFEGIADELEAFEQDIGDHVLDDSGDHRADVIAAVNNVFDDLRNEMAPGLARDFVLALVRELVLAAVPTVQDNGPLPPSLNYDIEDSRVAQAIVRHCLYQVVLRDLYVEHAEVALFETLERAKFYRPEGEERYDWEVDMAEDFFDYRNLMGPLAEEDGFAWKAQERQEPMVEWAETLEELVSILEPLNSALNAIADAYFGSGLGDTADAVKGLIIALDSFQVLNRAIEFGLKVQCLDIFGEQVQPLYLAVFPEEVIGGDVDGNDIVNAVDVQFVINAVLGMNPSWSFDVNKDGKFDAVDVQLVVKAALGLDILDDKHARIYAPL
ncbi:MAG: dockerin type I domain-containing protein [Candidatus Hydrogenedentota bacterium]